MPAFEMLEQRGLKSWLFDARQLKYMSGRKSDVQLYGWPTSPSCVVGDVSRTASELGTRRMHSDWFLATSSDQRVSLMGREPQITSNGCSR